MRWAWKLGRIAGIDVRIHATFLLLLAWIGLLNYLSGHTWKAAAIGVLFILAIFGTVVMHELGHALTARRFGIRTFDITLLPIGGVARLERIPEVPRQEFLVAIAGPAVNLAIAGLLFAVLGPGWIAGAFPGAIDSVPSFLGRFAWVNLTLALFNLLPAFPMDGGRAFRAILSTRMSYVAATQAAARLGQGLALAFGMLGLLFNPILVFIALFVWISASEESSATQIRAGLHGIPVQQAMVTDFRVLAPEDPLSLPVQHSLHGFQRDFPVCKEGRLVGLLTHRRLLEVLSKEGETAPVAQAMEEGCETAEPGEMLFTVLPRLQASGGRALPVVREGQVVGLLTVENFGEMMLLHAALHQRPNRQGGP